MEKTAAFYGFSDFKVCLSPEKDDTDGVIYDRMINIMSHGNYSIFDPTEMQEENKVYFSKLVRRFLDTYRFNEELFNELDKGENYGNKRRRDFLGNREEVVETDGEGCATFTCNGGSVSVWVLEAVL